MSHLALDAIKICETKFNLKVCLIDIFSINFSKKNFLKNIKNSNTIITIEEHILPGGLGSMIAELLFDNKKNKIHNLIRMGIKFDDVYNYKPRNLIHKANKIRLNDIVKTLLGS